MKRIRSISLVLAVLSCGLGAVLLVPAGAGVGDTVFVGLVPGRYSAVDNYWSIGVAARRPPNPGGMWDWSTNVHGDALQGWWPIRELDTPTVYRRGDVWRPYWAIDMGNTANYVLNYDTPAPHRTFGVVGVWHVDQGNAAGAANGVTWSPLAGGASAWMGLRRHGDTQFKDPITLSAFNEDLLQYAGVNSGVGNTHGFPGYGSQMDQMLYRDISVAGQTTQVMTLSYRYQTRMSTGYDTRAATRTGWFNWDPQAVVARNFISSTDAGSHAPVDSFMVYIGVPAEGTFRASDGLTTTILDPLRRWFSEVLRTDVPYYELATVAGDNGPALCSLPIPSEVLSDIAARSGGLARIVFRVKTNRGYDDEGALYSSGGAGAVVLDDVSIQFGASPATVIGSFETPGEIDNTQPATTAWRSTGRPPPTYPHVEDVSSGAVRYEDLNGQPDGPNRLCNMMGGVIVTGIHDQGEFSNDFHFGGGVVWESSMGIVSPTILLGGPYDRPGATNAIGLTQAQAAPTVDYFAAFDLYDGGGDGSGGPVNNGQYCRVGSQCYPVNDRNGHPGWGQIRWADVLYMLPGPECVQQMIPLRANGLISTSNSSGVPDSVRIVLSKASTCFTFGLSARCYQDDGLYFDNVSLALVNASTASPAPPPPPFQVGLQIDGADLFHDAFPFNETPGLPGTAWFDTTTALIKTGRNVAQWIVDYTGDTTASTCPAIRWWRAPAVRNSASTWCSASSRVRGTTSSPPAPATTPVVEYPTGAC